MKSEELYLEIEAYQKRLQQHPLYESMLSVESMRQFMQVHIFAVWDFMSLLKRLQNDITGMSIPWMPSKFSKKSVRLINEIVLGEESDECPKSIHEDGYCDHFTMYLRAMNELGISDLFYFEQIKHLNLDVLPSAVKKFVLFHLSLAKEGSIEEVAGSFLYGREKLLPSLFQEVVEQIKLEEIKCPYLTYYLERHIEIDSEHHGHMAKELFDEICDTEEKRVKGLEAALVSLKHRDAIWTHAQQRIFKNAGSSEKRRLTETRA